METFTTALFDVIFCHIQKIIKDDFKNMTLSLDSFYLSDNVSLIRYCCNIHNV